MRAKLVVVGGEAQAAEIQLKLPTLVGRSREASLVLSHPLVSRQHCEICESKGQLLVRDLGSLNGTFIGKERISQATLLPGQLLTVGIVTFRAVYGEMLEQEEAARDGSVNVAVVNKEDETMGDPNLGTVHVDDALPTPQKEAREEENPNGGLSESRQQPFLRE